MAARDLLIELALPLRSRLQPGVLVEVEKYLFIALLVEPRLHLGGQLVVAARMADEDRGQLRSHLKRATYSVGDPRL